MTKAQDNVILTTLTVKEGSDPLVDLEFVYRAIKTSMDSGGVSSEVIIETVNPELRKEAAASGISTGRVLLKKKALENNLPVSNAEIGTMNLSNIEKDKKVSVVGLLGEESGNNTKVYNLDQGEGSSAVEQGIYAERNNANIKIKIKPENGNNQNENDGKNSMNQNNSKK